MAQLVKQAGETHRAALRAEPQQAMPQQAIST
jgi:hypothetical protein